MPKPKHGVNCGCEYCTGDGSGIYNPNIGPMPKPVPLPPPKGRARELAGREVESTRAHYMKAVADLDAAHADYMAALRDLADYWQDMADDYKLASEADYEPVTYDA
jgi:hypothetical protein